MNTQRRHRAGALASCVALMAMAVSPVAAKDEGFTGEVFTTPGGARWRVRAGEAGGDKSLVGPGGARAASVAEAVALEDAALSPLARRVHGTLRDAAFDLARADEMLSVVLVLRVQPVHEAADGIRGEFAEAIEGPLSELRSLLSKIAPLREDDLVGERLLGHRIEEESRLLSPEQREEARRLRASMQTAVRAFRARVVALGFPAADAATSPVEAAVRALPGAVVLGRSRVLCAVSASMRAGDLAPLLESLPQIDRALPHGRRRASLDVSVPTLGGSSWTGAGYDGSSNTVVAIMDTGVDGAHPSLSAAMGGAGVFLEAAAAGPYFQDDAGSTDDLHGHGTHVAGIAGGRDATNRGVAYGASLLNAKCGYLLVIDGQGYGALEDADIMAAGDWAASRGADAVNASFGGEATTDGGNALSLFFDALADDLGITAAVAAGNAGSGAGTVGVPADAFNVITVGALDDAGTTSHGDNSLAAYSSRGPLDDGRRKPDLVAPGSNITSCSAGWEGGAADFVGSSGTSMAAPHVAGAAALLYDYAAAWRPEGLKALLASTARNTSPYPTTPDSNWGVGAADLAAAFTSRASVREGTLTAGGPEFAFLRAGSLPSGRRATLVWNREVTSNGDEAPQSYRAVADLDLLVYEEFDESSRGTSTSALNNIEQVKVSSATVFPILKVRRIGAMPAGQTGVRWAVATESASETSIVAPPAPVCSFPTLPAVVAGNQEFTVEVVVNNVGGLPASWPEVTLTVPEGYTIVEGDNPLTVVTIPVEGMRTASWTVRSAGTGAGVRTFAASATTRSFEEEFASPTAEATQGLDLGGPQGVAQLENGRIATNDPSMDLRVLAVDDRAGVDSMRVRNEGDPWGPWGPYTEQSIWVVSAGDGLRTVEVMVRDTVANESVTLSDSILLDTLSPTGTFELGGGRGYILPWETIHASTLSADVEGGSGVAEFRVRWLPSTAPTPWLTPDGAGVVLLDRPAREGVVDVEGRFRDGAGNESAPHVVRTHLIEVDAPTLDGVSRTSGVLSAQGGVLAYPLDLVAGDLLTIGVKARSAVKKGEFGAASDLFDPDGVQVVEERHPADGRKAGIAAWPVANTGRHWLVVHRSGADGDAGGSVALAVKVKQAKSNAKPAATVIVDAETGEASFSFEAAAGSTLKAVMKRSAGSGAPVLVSPDGETTSPPTKTSSDGRKVSLKGVPLTGSTGTWTLRLPAENEVEFHLQVTPGKRTPAD